MMPLLLESLEKCHTQGSTNLIHYNNGCFQKPIFREAVQYQEMFLTFPIFLCLAVE